MVKVAPLVGAWIEIPCKWEQRSGGQVAPLVGAWIEIEKVNCLCRSGTRRSPRGSVDWNTCCLIAACADRSRSPRGSVDWNRISPWSLPRCQSRSPRGSVDWNRATLVAIEEKSVAPLVGAWIEIGSAWKKTTIRKVAPLVGAWIEILTRSRNWSTLERRSPCGSDDWNRKDNRI